MIYLPPKIMLKMENREILNSPSVQHVAANIRLNPNGQTVVFELIWRCELLAVRFDDDEGVSMSLAPFIVLCVVVLFITEKKGKFQMKMLE